MKTRNWVAVIAGLALLVSVSQAETYLVNGGFETGDLTGWTQNVGGNHQVVSSFGAAITPRSGSFFDATDWRYDTNTLTQEIAGGGKQGVLTGYIYLEDLSYWPGFIVSDGTNTVVAMIGYSSQYVGDDIIYLTRNGWGDTVPTSIQVTANTWHKMQYVVDDNGLDFYWDDTLAMENYASMTTISSIAIGGGWNTTPTGYDDFTFVDATTPPDCATAMALGYGLKEDLTGDCYVDLADLAKFSQDWLRCISADPNDLESECETPWLPPTPPPPPPTGRIAYLASVAPAMTIDGVLTEWPANDYNPATPNDSQWIAIDKTFYGFPYQATNAFLCLMYNPTTDVIYGAVTVDDSNPYYGFLGSWNTQDNIELYIQGDPANDTPLNPSPLFANAQQFFIGLNGDQSTTWMRWGIHPTYPVIGANGETDPVDLAAAVKRTIAGSVHHVVYEFKVVPYDNYGGLNSSATVQTDLYSGATIALDIILDVKSAGFGMLCPNDMTNKAADVTKYATVTCE